MILNSIICLVSFFSSVNDTTYTPYDSLIYFKNFATDLQIKGDFPPNNIHCMSLSELNKKISQQYISNKKNDSLMNNEGSAIRNIITSFYMQKFVWPKFESLKDSIELKKEIDKKSQIAFIGKYKTIINDTQNHFVMQANFRYASFQKYITPSFGEFIFLITATRTNIITSIVALKAQRSGGFHYYSKLNPDNTFTAYEPLDAPDVSVDMNSLSSEEKKEYLEANNNLEIRYSKYKIDENGYVVLFKTLTGASMQGWQ